MAWTIWGYDWWLSGRNTSLSCNFNGNRRPSGYWRKATGALGLLRIGYRSTRKAERKRPAHGRFALVPGRFINAGSPRRRWPVAFEVVYFHRPGSDDKEEWP